MALTEEEADRFLQQQESLQKALFKVLSRKGASPAVELTAVLGVFFSLSLSRMGLKISAVKELLAEAVREAENIWEKTPYEGG